MIVTKVEMAEAYEILKSQGTSMFRAGRLTLPGIGTQMAITEILTQAVEGGSLISWVQANRANDQLQASYRVLDAMMAEGEEG